MGDIRKSKNIEFWHLSVSFNVVHTPPAPMKNIETYQSKVLLCVDTNDKATFQEYRFIF